MEKNKLKFVAKKIRQCALDEEKTFEILDLAKFTKEDEDELLDLLPEFEVDLIFLIFDYFDKERVKENIRKTESFKKHVQKNTHPEFLSKLTLSELTEILFHLKINDISIYSSIDLDLKTYGSLTSEQINYYEIIKPVFNYLQEKRAKEDGFESAKEWRNNRAVAFDKLLSSELDLEDFDEYKKILYPNKVHNITRFPYFF